MANAIVCNYPKLELFHFIACSKICIIALGCRLLIHFINASLVAVSQYVLGITKEYNVYWISSQTILWLTKLIYKSIYLYIKIRSEKFIPLGLRLLCRGHHKKYLPHLDIGADNRILEYREIYIKNINNYKYRSEYIIYTYIYKLVALPGSQHMYKLRFLGRNT